MSQELAILKRQKISELLKIYNNDLKNLTNAYNNERGKILQNRLIPSRLKTSTLNQLYIKFVNDKKTLITNYNNSVLKINAMTMNDFKPQTTTVTSSQQQSQTVTLPLKNKKTALLIGINYIGTSNQLSGCINDITSINDLLKTINYDNIIMLTDNTGVKPTKTNIINNLISILSNANDGDTVYIHYSGHGTSTYDTNYDETDGRDEVIVPLDFNLIKDDELRQCINTYLKSNANVLAIFDCCYSGTVLDLKYLYQSENNNTFSQNLKESDTKGNVVLISGCRDDQLSSEAYISTNRIEGAMSWTFKQTLKEKGTNISWKTLIDRMREILINGGLDQVPQLSSGKIIDINNNLYI